MDRKTLAAALLGLLLGAAGVGAGEPDSGPRPVAGDRPTGRREDLRYDDKNFEEWRTFALTEVKATRRLEAVRALREFGLRGYAKEAVSTILEIVRDYEREKLVDGETRLIAAAQDTVCDLSSEAM